MQYVVLKATLAGPNDRTEFPLKITGEDGVEEIVRRGTFPDNPSNFFAPEPPIVQWTLRKFQPLLPEPLPGTNQPCREEECLPEFNNP
jgi:hypothetical protein